MAGVDALEHGDALVGAQPGMELPVADVERDHPSGAALQEAVGEATRRGAEVEAVPPRGIDLERVERVRELLAAAGDEPRRALDVELGVVGDLRAGLREARHEPGEHERLRLRAALGETALDEQDVEPLAHAGHSRCRVERRISSRCTGHWHLHLSAVGVTSDNRCQTRFPSTPDRADSVPVLPQGFRGVCWAFENRCQTPFAVKAKACRMCAGSSKHNLGRSRRRSSALRAPQPAEALVAGKPPPAALGALDAHRTPRTRGRGTRHCSSSGPT